MTMNKNDYIEKLEAKLAQSGAEIEKLKAKAAEAKVEARMEYQRQIDKLSVKQTAAEKKLEAIREASIENWEKLKRGMDDALTTLQEEFKRFNEVAAQKSKDKSLGWPTGLASERVIKSIGWAEGIAEEDEVESIGWAQGQAKEKEVKSVGWAEGYDKK